MLQQPSDSVIEILVSSFGLIEGPLCGLREEAMEVGVSNEAVGGLWLLVVDGSLFPLFC